jgi:hypothetical protein
VKNCIHLCRYLVLSRVTTLSEAVFLRRFLRSCAKFWRCAGTRVCLVEGGILPLLARFLCGVLLQCLVSVACVMPYIVPEFAVCVCVAETGVSRPKHRLLAVEALEGIFVRVFMWVWGCSGVQAVCQHGGHWRCTADSYRDPVSSDNVRHQWGADRWRRGIHVCCGGDQRDLYGCSFLLAA